MIDDDVFGYLVIAVAVGAFLNKFIEGYGYEKLIADIQRTLILIVIVIVIGIILFFVIRNAIYKIKDASYRKSSKSISKHKTKEKPKIQEIAEPKKEISEIKEQCTTKLVSQKPKPKRLAEEKVIDINIELDEDIRFYHHKKLDKYEIQYLKDKGFTIRTLTNPFTSKKERFVFKTNGNESDIHFLVIQLIVEYIKNKVNNIQTFETVKPDVVFEINKTYAIEVETGKVLQHNRKNLINKVKLLNKNYDDWFFVVTNRNLVSKYRKYGKVIDTRYLKNQLDKFLECRKFS